MEEIHIFPKVIFPVFLPPPCTVAQKGCVTSLLLRVLTTTTQKVCNDPSPSSFIRDHFYNNAPRGDNFRWIARERAFYGQLLLHKKCSFSVLG